jgi:hypothetical protein
MYCKNKRHVNAMQVGDADADRNGMMQARDTYLDRDRSMKTQHQEGQQYAKQRE